MIKKKKLQKVGIEGTYINMIKAVYDKPTTNIIFDDKELNAFPLTSYPSLSVLGWVLQEANSGDMKIHVQEV